MVAMPFEQIKTFLTSDLCLPAYNPDKETFLVTDASKSGVGYLLLQDADEGEEQEEEDENSDKDEDS